MAQRPNSVRKVFILVVAGNSNTAIEQAEQANGANTVTIRLLRLPCDQPTTLKDETHRKKQSWSPTSCSGGRFQDGTPKGCSSCSLQPQ